MLTERTEARLTPPTVPSGARQALVRSPWVSIRRAGSQIHHALTVKVGAELNSSCAGQVRDKNRLQP